jgi:2,3-bisphosphoglycerate-independent phosphoglycerate mutase
MPTTPVVLLILDGFGARPAAADNAISQAKTPHLDRLWKTCPHTFIDASEQFVGLPKGQFGNSEVGHLNIGAGRVVYMDLTRIDRAIETGEFEKNAALNLAVKRCISNENPSPPGRGAGVREARSLNETTQVPNQPFSAPSGGRTLHVLGLLSPGGVHSHERHIHALIRFAAKSGVQNIAVHAFTDGRDMPPKSAGESIKAIESVLNTCGAKQAKIASISGRFYAMDRDKRWDRVEKAFNAIVHAKAAHNAPTAMDALTAAYARGENDEFVVPTLVNGGAPIRDGDAVILMNFRADRAREITEAIAFENFAGFARGTMPKLSAFVCLSFYGDAYAHLPTGFRNDVVVDGFAETLAKAGLTQLRIAETEKYAHVTYFFSGGQEKPFAGETRVMVPSPKVETYDLKPEMSAPEVSEKLAAAIRNREFNAYICNFANGDMVGHTGDLQAAIKAVEALDDAVGKVVAAAQAAGAEVLITADHGNCEQMYDPTSGQAHTQHTTNKVPCIYVGRKGVTLRDGGALSDISPTLLTMMGVKMPKAMTGKSVVGFG